MKMKLFVPGILLILFACSAERMNFNRLQDRNGLYFLVNEEKPYSGDVVSYANGKTVFEGSIENGLKTGLWVYYYPSGQKKMEGEYLDGLLEGNWTYWKENEEQEKIEVYKYGKLLTNEETDPGPAEDTVVTATSEQKAASPEPEKEVKKVAEKEVNKEVKKEVKKEPKPVIWESLHGGPVKYLNGIPYTGPVVKYFKNGNMELEGYFLAGKRSGYWTFYNPNGTFKNTKYY